MELRAKIMSPGTVEANIFIPVEKVLTQLATGSVKITFGELRQMAPGVFANSGGECDGKPVVLPLNQILAQLNPALLGRRSAQKTVELTDDIISPFDTRGKGLTITLEPIKTTAPTPSTPATPPPMSRFAVPAPEKSSQPMPVVPPPAFAPRWTVPAAGETKSHNGNGAPKPVSISAAAVPGPSAPPIPPKAAVPEQSQPTISAPLNSLAECWPEAVRMEIGQLNLSGAKVDMPLELVEPALKRGRVIFSWRNVRLWIKPTPPAVSAHDNVELEMPLNVLAPLFFSRQKSQSKSNRKVAVTEDIPNLFSGSQAPPSVPQQPAPLRLSPAPAPTAVAAATPPSDTNYFIRANEPQVTDTEFKRKGGTDFLTRGAAPGEVVERAMNLPGVAGAIIALPDGLKVASQIPPDLNGDTLAAFIPQIFARVNQCSRELRMGDLNNLSFTVGNVPWKIFRVNAVYFAAFGRANEGLPAAPLAELATALDRKNQ